ncbi:hypothetical protein J2787_002432 [Chryseobacterium rhizosphaerae]|uniref:Uncharacterized protein n=1 Tax=Chryseobacterium rhizosphaerae TaxID=395937 RepID=A0AAE3YAJ7_9FLAO|nr:MULTISPECIES: hypothetical protein [Chryseobacterium]MBL3546955.1 hypothetical protein [Chryseobacterium sp. KMC2]MDR6527052.1 hypothetical protein [Chryseobacterium rhizosphaerae]
MGFYSKFSEQDLIESYKNQIDYQGKPDKEIIDEIISRGTLEDFQNKIKAQNLFLNEQNRLIREIHGYYMNKLSKQECLSLLSSDLLSDKSIGILVDRKYNQIHQKVENLKVDSDTLIYSFIGTIIASVLSTVIILAILYKFIFLSVFSFSLLIPAYIMNYWIIRLFTGKTRDNLAVFIASFIATVLNCVYFVLFVN